MMAWLIFLGLIVLVGGAALGFLWLIVWQDVCPRAAIEATGNSHLVIASKERTGKLRVGDSKLDLLGVSQAPVETGVDCRRGADRNQVRALWPAALTRRGRRAAAR